MAFVDDLHLETHIGNYILMIFLASDTADREVLVKHLYDLVGTHKTVLNWFCHFVAGRSKSMVNVL